MVKDKNLEKQYERQLGCMAGFFQLFDRHQIITGKRLHGNKRFPHSKVVDDEESSEISCSSTPAFSMEFVKPALVTDNSEHVNKSPAQELPPLKSPHQLPVFQLKEEIRSSLNFTKETRRLSLDSRAIVDSNGSIHLREIRTNSSILMGSRNESSASAAVGDRNDKHCRSPTVIARLMGIEQLPEWKPESDDAQLRRSASESRVVRDLFKHPTFVNTSSSQLLNPTIRSHSDSVVQNVNVAVAAINQTKCLFPSNVTRSTNAMESNSPKNTDEHHKAVNRGSVSSQWKSQQHRKSFFDTADIFPEPEQTMSAYADIEKKLKVRGIDDSSKDLETLTQILEAMQLKGLLHSSSKLPEHRNFVHHLNFRNDESQIVVMKASQSTTGRILGNQSSFSLSRTTTRRNLNEKLSTVTVTPRWDKQPQNERNVRSPTKTLNSPAHNNSNGRRNSSSAVKTNKLRVETQQRRDESSDTRKISSVQFPRTRSTIDQTVTSKSPRYKRSSAGNYQKEKIKTVVTEDESSSISESTLSTSSQPETEKCKMKDFYEGKSLLERCDKLLQNISEMNANELQPSPVSVLDLYKEDSFSSPSPVPKRTIDFQDLSSELEEEWWSSILEANESSMLKDEHNQDSDFVYILQILRAFDQFPQYTDIYHLLEKQQNDIISKASLLHRRLIFDIIIEIIESNKQLPPWKAFLWIKYPLSSKPLLQKICADFRRIRAGGGDSKVVVVEEEEEEDIFEFVCCVLEKDLAAYEWEDFPVELSEVVLDVERLVFKDLIGDTITELAQYPWRNPAAAAVCRRKLVF